MDRVASAVKDHRARIKSIQRKRLIVYSYEQVMSHTPYMHRTLTYGALHNVVAIVYPICVRHEAIMLQKLSSAPKITYYAFKKNAYYSQNHATNFS